MNHKCLTIAGFDGSGGAGLQADLKTFSAFGCYGLSVLTALPVQNTCGVRCCYSLPIESIDAQLEAIFDDMIPNSIKIGMLFSTDIIHRVARFLEKHAKNIPIVLDPVMVAKSGDLLLQPDAIDTLKTELIPLATIITPNLPEAFTLIHETDDLQLLAQSLLNLGSTAVLLKGGHTASLQSNDLYLDKHGIQCQLEATRIHSKNTHGTGCTLSAAICAGLALKLSPLDACQHAKRYLTGAIEAAREHNVGKGQGSVHHFYQMKSDAVDCSL